MAGLPGVEEFQARIGIQSDRPRAFGKPWPVHLKKKKYWKQWPTDQFPPRYSELVSTLDQSNYPELEDEPLLEWGLKHNKAEKEPKAVVDVVYGKGTDLNFSYDVTDPELEKIVLDTAHVTINEQHFRVFFISTMGSDNGWLRGNFSIRPSTLTSLRKAGMSSLVLAAIYSSEGFWAKMGNQCFTHRDERGDLASFELAYRYTCGWDQGVCFTQFVRTRNHHTYFCINYPSRARQKVETYLRQHPAYAYRPFFLDTTAADDCLKEWQLNIGERRESLIYHERKRKYNDATLDFNTETIQLHTLARDWYTLEQCCAVLYDQLTFLQEAYEKYRAQLLVSKNDWVINATSDISEIFEVLKSTCDNYTRWTVVYRDRTSIRINLLFHLVNQRESRTSTQIAASSAKIAEQTRRDSASMITIAAVTMLFLPGTFISAIMSTTFFDYGPDGLNVSKQWWILPATTIPLMILVFAVWVGWQWMRFGKTTSEAHVKSA